MVHSGPTWRLRQVKMAKQQCLSFLIFNHHNLIIVRSQSDPHLFKVPNEAHSHSGGETGVCARPYRAHIRFNGFTLEHIEPRAAPERSKNWDTGADVSVDRDAGRY